MLVGYAEKLSVTPGSSLRFYVSGDDGQVEGKVVRLIHGDENPNGPGRRAEDVPEIPPVTATVRPQSTYPGSCVVVEGRGGPLPSELTLLMWAWPTATWTGRPQALLGIGGPGGLSVMVGSGGKLLIASGDRTYTVTEEPVVERSWALVGVTVKESTAHVFVLDPHGRRTVLGRPVSVDPPDLSQLTFAARAVAAEGAKKVVIHPFNGKLEHPRLVGRAVPPGLLEGTAADVEQWAATSELLGDWHFEDQPESTSVKDRSPWARGGECVNIPARAVTGHLWDGSVLNLAALPEHYGAIHFHEDDLSDCRWEPTIEVEVPETLPSGIYSLVVTGPTQSDEIPFMVVPNEGTASSRVALVIPTWTYIAYANERIIDSYDEESLTALGSNVPNHYQEMLARHTEIGGSLYDRHLDGSGVCFSTCRRPILNMRPTYRDWHHNAPRHFPADLYIVDWLTQQDVAFDVLTDDELDQRGVDGLEPYDVVVTGSHPEYCSSAMLDSLEHHLAGGGNLMYLGGNGFYWVTSRHPADPGVLEVRRGHAGLRTWESLPGEDYHSSTGEPGGLWRHRGRTPNALVGVGFAGMGWDAKASSYRRTEASYSSDAAFVFAGVDDEIIGSFGLVMNGAAGDEIDRYDPTLGTPANTVVLATSEGGHSDQYQPAVEDVPVIRGRLGGSVNPDLRADIVLVEHPGGGKVFSVGSICYSGSLSHDGYSNNVSRLTRNVLDHFTATGRPRC